MAIIVHPEGAIAGAVDSDGFTVRERIPQSHKIALRRIAEYEPVMRYGQIIGFATRPIEPGSWVREEHVELPPAPPLGQVPIATAVPKLQAPLTDVSFEGYRNQDGSTGTKNILGITTTVQCVAPTVDYAVRRIKAEILPRFPNVDDVIAITHSYGCGVAIDAVGAAIPIRTLKNISLHPNISSQPMVVSLG